HAGGPRRRAQLTQAAGPETDRGRIAPVADQIHWRPLLARAGTTTCRLLPRRHRLPYFACPYVLRRAIGSLWGCRRRRFRKMASRGKGLGQMQRRTFLQLAAAAAAGTALPFRAGASVTVPKPYSWDAS